MALGLTPYQKEEVRGMILAELLKWKKAEQEACKHVEGVMHKDGSVTCKTCHYMTTPPYDADL